MLENKSALYAAFMAKDTRFDGRFFVGISSTGIYCRPVCRAKKPKAENCTFYHTAAEAEQAGYRPCLLCRPELAPGSSITDSTKDKDFFICQKILVRFNVPDFLLCFYILTVILMKYIIILLMP